MSRDAEFTGEFVGAAQLLPIVEVTLLEDRARVRRRGSLRVGPNAPRVRVEAVAPVLADKTLVARVVSGSAQVADARAVREWVFDPTSVAGLQGATLADARQAVLEELLRRDRAEAELACEQETDGEQLAGLATLAAQTLGDLAVDVAAGRDLAAQPLAPVMVLNQDARALRANMAARARRLQEHREHSGCLRQRLAALTQPSHRMRAALLLDFDVAEAADVVVEVDYVVPNALWRPAHAAELDGARLRFTTAACVWQNTGEDWCDVQLSFSTERASLGAEPPRLDSDVLEVRKRQERVVVETREQVVQVASVAGAVAAREVPGIDDGGSAVALRARERVSVPSDGRPLRVPLDEFTADVRTELWAYPELSSAVVTKTRQTNGLGRPLLAGPVELLREGGGVGRAVIGFVAPGEEFDLAWGPDQDLRVRRSTEESDADARFLSSWIARTHVVRVRVSNLGSRRPELFVRERVPVSEVEQVKIEFDAAAATDGVRPDADGFVTWRVLLGPQAQREFELRYVLRRKSDITGV